MTDDDKSPDEVQGTVPATDETAAPVEQETATPVETKEAEPAEETKGEEDAPVEETKRKRSAKERVEKMAREKRAAVNEAQQLRERLKRYEDQKTPDPAKYDDLDQLEADRAASAAAKVRKAEVEHEVTDADERATSARQAEWAARVTEFKDEAPDFEQVVFQNAQLPISATMAEILMDADSGPQVAYYLGKNPVEAAQIAGQNEREQALAIGRIEGRLNTKPVRRTTQAPEPVKTVSGNSPGAVSDIAKMDMKTYAAHMNKLEAERLKEQGR